MSDDTAKELAACLEYAAMVNRVLPTDDEDQRIVDALLARSQPSATSRKLVRKTPDSRAGRHSLLDPPCSCLDSSRPGCEFHGDSK